MIQNLKHFVWLLGFASFVMTACAEQSDYIIEQKEQEGVPLDWIRPEFQPELLNVEAPQDNAELVARIDVPAEEFVPLGVYSGDYGDKFWSFMLEDLKANHCNLIFPNGNASWPLEWYFGDDANQSNMFSSSGEGLKQLTRMAANSGIRVYYQNGNSPLHWPIREHIGGPRPAIYEKASRWIHETLPAFAEDPVLKAGMLAWGITEEIDEPTARDPLLKKLKEEVQILDPYHPPLVVIMPHTADVQEALIETWGGLPIVVTDHYLNHRGLNQAGLAGFNLTRLKLWSDLARKNNAKLWVMPACFSMMSDLRPEGKGGYRTLDPREVSMSMWTALAHGASGLILFKYYDDDSWGRSCLTRFDLEPTEEYIAASRIFRRAKRLAPLIGKWKLIGEIEADMSKNLVVGHFKHPEYKGNFHVVANITADQSATYERAVGAIELEGMTRITAPLELGGGEGAFLFTGPTSEVKRMLETFGPGLTGMTKQTLTVKQAELWQWANDEIVKDDATNQITFGGKGATPSIQRPSIDSPQRGDLIEWGNGIMLPSGMYYPPYPGANEKALYSSWDIASLDDVAEVDRAVLTLSFAEAVEGGRLAVYAVAKNGLGMEGESEYMPRWERPFIKAKAGETVNIDVTGLVAQWVNGELENQGLFVVYEGYPSEQRTVMLANKPSLQVIYLPTEKD